jgi:lipid-A-disaccharide synthase
MTTNSPLIAIIAGEDSGDQLGADLIVPRCAASIRTHDSQASAALACKSRASNPGTTYASFRCSVSPKWSATCRVCSSLRKELVARLIAEKPIVVIGIDAPDFNLGVERRLKQAVMLTVHYVSPSIWAWRENRAEKIGHSANRVLCLFPMEPPIYAKHGIDARFVGHPLADRFPLVSDRIPARRTLQLPLDVPVLAVLPGSRASELERMGAIFLDAARRVASALPGLRIVIPCRQHANARDA